MPEPTVGVHVEDLSRQVVLSVTVPWNVLVELDDAAFDAQFGQAAGTLRAELYVIRQRERAAFLAQNGGGQ